MNASTEVDGAGGVATGGATEAVAAGVVVKTGGSRVGGPELCV